MATTNFKTENNTYRKLIGNGLTYRIPPFQRDYSWGEEEWEDLWADLIGTLAAQEEPAHYMGYLVLQSEDDKTFDVIDGQQRLTTLTLLVLAVLKNLQRLIDAGHNPEENSQRSEQLRRSQRARFSPGQHVSWPVSSGSSECASPTRSSSLRSVTSRPLTSKRCCGRA